MMRHFKHGGKDYTVTVEDNETERTLHVRSDIDKQSRFSLSIRINTIVEAKGSGIDLGLGAMSQMLVDDFKRLVDENLLVG